MNETIDASAHGLESLQSGAAQRLDAFVQSKRVGCDSSRSYYFA